MRILVLTKRYYTSKDLLEDRYGRVFELPAWLSRLGHDVTGLALAYRPSRENIYIWPDLPGLKWHSVNLISPLRYIKFLRNLLRDHKPDLIWVCSDIFHVILGSQISRFYEIPVIADLYDNFESFGASKIPGAVSLFRQACRNVSGLTVVGMRLNEYISKNYQTKKPRLVLNNGVDLELFYPRNKKASRECLGLPVDGRLIGTAGAISANRGIEVLFKSFEELSKKHTDTYLVIAGPKDKSLNVSNHPRIIDMGVLPLEAIPCLFSALDLGIVCNIDTPFGRYCYPQKFAEMAACKIPIIAASIGETAALLMSNPFQLFTPNKPEDLGAKIDHFLLRQEEYKTEVPVKSWKSLAEDLEKFFQETKSSSQKPRDP